MPIPKPQRKEQEQHFIGRCVRKLQSEHGKRQLKQNIAICYTTWRKHKNMGGNTRKEHCIKREAGEYFIIECKKDNRKGEFCTILWHNGKLTHGVCRCCGNQVDFNTKRM